MIFKDKDKDKDKGKGKDKCKGKNNREHREEKINKMRKIIAGEKIIAFSNLVFLALLQQNKPYCTERVLYKMYSSLGYILGQNYCKIGGKGMLNRSKNTIQIVKDNYTTIGSLEKTTIQTYYTKTSLYYIGVRGIRLFLSLLLLFLLFLRQKTGGISKKNNTFLDLCYNIGRQRTIKFSGSILYAI